MFNNSFNLSGPRKNHTSVIININQMPHKYFQDQEIQECSLFKKVDSSLLISEISVCDAILIYYYVLEVVNDGLVFSGLLLSGSIMLSLAFF